MKGRGEVHYRLWHWQKECVLFVLYFKCCMCCCCCWQLSACHLEPKVLSFSRLNAPSNQVELSWVELSRAQWNRIMSQQPAEGSSECRNFLIKILQSALSSRGRGRQGGSKSTEIEEGLRHVSSLHYNNECLMARRPCGQVQPLAGRVMKTSRRSPMQMSSKRFSHFAAIFAFSLLCFMAIY